MLDALKQSDHGAGDPAESMAGRISTMSSTPVQCSEHDSRGPVRRARHDPRANLSFFDLDERQARQGLPRRNCPDITQLGRKAIVKGSFSGTVQDAGWQGDRDSGQSSAGLRLARLCSSPLRRAENYKDYADGSVGQEKTAAASRPRMAANQVRGRTSRLRISVDLFAPSVSGRRSMPSSTCRRPGRLHAHEPEGHAHQPAQPSRRRSEAEEIGLPTGGVIGLTPRSMLAYLTLETRRR